MNLKCFLYGNHPNNHVSDHQCEMKQLLLVNIHLFTIRHPAEVARVKIEKLKRIPILHNSNLTNQRVLQVYQYFIFAIEQF